MESHGVPSSYRRRFGPQGSSSWQAPPRSFGLPGPATRTNTESGERLDFAADSVLKAQFREKRGNEKVEMMGLNDRLAGFLEKVRVLEQQNQVLVLELDQIKARESSRVGDVYQEELKKLRRQVDQLSSSKAGLELQKKNLSTDVTSLKLRLQEEAGQRQEAENDLKTFRQDVDEACLARVTLERKMEVLQDELDFLERIHQEELQELQEQVQVQQVHMDMDGSRPDLTAALREIRVQYENVASSNMQETEELYRSKFSDLTDSANRNAEALRQSKHEVHEYRRQVQVLSCDLDSLRASNQNLQLQLSHEDQRSSADTSRYQDHVERLEQQVQTLKEQMGRHLQEYQDLLNVKMALEVEIATYRKLLEGEESRINIPVKSFS